MQWGNNDVIRNLTPIWRLGLWNPFSSQGWTNPPQDQDWSIPRTPWSELDSDAWTRGRWEPAARQVSCMMSDHGWVSHCKAHPMGGKKPRPEVTGSWAPIPVLRRPSMLPLGPFTLKWDNNPRSSCKGKWDHNAQGPARRKHSSFLFSF